MDAPARAVRQLDRDLAEIKPSKLPGHALEADQELLRQRGPHLAQRAIDRAEPERLPLLLEPLPQLPGRQRRLRAEQRLPPPPAGARA